MDNDDILRGRLLSRREILAIMGAGGAALFLGGPVPGLADSGTGPIRGCVVRPELTEGPYFVDENLNRSDIRSDPSDGVISAGALLALTFSVSRLTSACAPLAGATVDVWQCDAAGQYSDVKDKLFDTVGRKFLRGHQVTNADGVVKFTTIYPGWYPTRTVHIHFKVRSPVTATSAYEFTSQLFFDDGFTDHVYTRPPYAGRGTRGVLNVGDRIFQQGRGSELLLAVTEVSEGYAATFDIALQGA
jgi:protocatechuate 3,4-dioxygenase beta subunit